MGMKEEVNWEVEGWRKHPRTLDRIYPLGKDWAWALSIPFPLQPGARIPAPCLKRAPPLSKPPVASVAESP